MIQYARRVVQKTGDDNAQAGNDQVAAAQISAAAEVLLPVAHQLIASSTPADSDQADPEGVGATKKGKMVGKVKCYRCGFSGHVLSDCKAELCDNCEGVDHVIEDCHLLTAPKPQIEIYGHAHEDLMFYGMPLTDSYRPKPENTRLGLLSMTRGSCLSLRSRDNFRGLYQLTRMCGRLSKLDIICTRCCFRPNQN